MADNQRIAQEEALMRKRMQDSPSRPLVGTGNWKERLTVENAKDDAFLYTVPDRSAMTWQLAKLAHRIGMPDHVQRAVIEDVLNDIYNYGILTELMQRPKVTTIWLAGDQWIEYREAGVIRRYDRAFESREALYRFIEHKLSGTPFRYARNIPEIDAILADGSRFHIRQGPVGTTVSLTDGGQMVYSCPVVTIRRFLYPYSLDELVSERQLRAYLKLLPLLGESFVVAGAQESGKSTTLNALTGFLPKHSRLILIEESPEMQPKYPVSLRMWNRGVPGDPTFVDMVSNQVGSLRMTGDIMMIGEVRSSEVLWQFLMIANLGLHMVATTLHASSAEDAILRMKMLGISAPARPAEKTVAFQIARGISHVIYLAREGEKRGVAEIREIVGCEGETVLSRPVFVRDVVTGKTEFLGLSDRMAKKLREKNVLPEVPLR